MRPRSYLYVPGDVQTRLEKAPGRGADALIVDLEDAVPLAEKAAARALVRSWLSQAEIGGCQVWVRVNPGDMMVEDLDALAGLTRLSGVVLAKTESADDAARADHLLTERDHSHLPVMPLLESASSVLQAQSIAAAPRVDCLQIGEADLKADVGITSGDDESELLFARSAVVFASAAAGLPPPVAAVSTEFRDLAAFSRTTEALARIGHTSRACIHPAQVDVVHAVMTPSAAARERAQRLVEAYEASAAQGVGTLTDEDGRLLDEAIVRQARRLLETAGAET